MNKYLYVETKTVYGNELVYPKCERSQVLAKLCGTKTFTDKHIRLILKLGYEFHPWMDGLKSKLEWKVLEAKVKADDNPYKHLIDKKIIKESDIINVEDYVSDEEVDAPTWLKPHELEKEIKNAK